MTNRSIFVLTGMLCSALAAFTCSDDGDSTSSDNTTSSTSGSGGATSGPGPGGTTVSTGGGMGMGGSGGLEMPMGWVVSPVPDLNNDAECLEWSAISPEPTENGHLYGVRLTPPSYPFTANEIVYELFHDGMDCDASAAHRVEVLAISGATPPNDPVNPTVIDVPEVTINDTGTRIVTLDLSPPITLQTDEHLFVAVEMIHPGATPITCLATCENASIFDRDWWSNAEMAPYNWETLESFGFPIHARIGANGM